VEQLLYFNSGVDMKRSGILAIFVIIIIVVLVIFSYFNFSFISRELNAPEAVIEINRSAQAGIMINEGDEILFSAQNSSDEDGDIEKYYWNFGDGSTSDDINALHTYSEPGTYNVTLTVEDDDGNKDIKYIEITVNSIPTAVARIQNMSTSDSVSIPIYSTIQFNGTGSFDSDGRIDNFQWDFGDGNKSTQANPVHQYRQLGKFLVKLTVFDNVGGEAEDTIEIESIKRTYSAKWILKQTEIPIQDNGYTFEGEFTEILEQINQVWIAQINITLTWEDPQPLLKNNESQGEDLFELSILSPENLSKIHNSTTGNITLFVKYNSQPKPKTLMAKTTNDAITQAMDEVQFTEGGNGEWYLNVSALECKGGNWIDERFDRDLGNSWSLTGIVFYYDLEVQDITPS
jgi:chitodextrinase